MRRACETKLFFFLPYALFCSSQKLLESKDDQIKIDALKHIIAASLHGEAYPRLLMPIIKYTLHSENHMIKKLVLIYWETIDKKQADGSPRTEMILVI